jgi:hypothetical protein
MRETSLVNFQRCLTLHVREIGRTDEEQTQRGNQGKKWERDNLFRTGRKSITLIEGSQDTPARLSDRNNVKVKTLGLQEVASNGQWNFQFPINPSIIWKKASIWDNFDEFKIGRAEWGACSGNLDLGKHLSICLKTGEDPGHVSRL